MKTTHIIALAAAAGLGLYLWRSHAGGAAAPKPLTPKTPPRNFPGNVNTGIVPPKPLPPLADEPPITLPSRPAPRPMAPIAAPAPTKPAGTGTVAGSFSTQLKGGILL